MESQSSLAEPLGKCISCAKDIFEDLYKCPQCSAILHGGDKGASCGAWIGTGKDMMKVCEYCSFHQ